MIDLSQIPTDPGCYSYFNKRKEIIYIGKAKNLRKRVKSYFQKTITDEKTKALVADIVSVDYFITSNEVEALILENNLIKKHRPKYNIDLKDTKRYAHILITAEKYPRVMVTRRKDRKGKYFGPYVSGESRNSIVRALQHTFQIRTCKKLPKRECLRYHIGLCSAPCIGKISSEQYDARVEKVESFLKGKSTDVIKNLKREMKSCAKSQEFERAKIIRDQVHSLESLQEKQNFELDSRYTADIINYIVAKEKVFVMVFRIDRGVLMVKNEYTFNRVPNFFEEFLVQYYSAQEVPKEIIIPQRVTDSAIITYLEKKRSAQVRLHVAQRGAKKKLMELVRHNIQSKYIEQNTGMKELGEALRLNATPYVMECFDISHTSGTNVVASMVQFRNGEADKAHYRRFKISVDTNDDFAAMREAVTRRYSRLKREGTRMPDLVVIDGGKGQLMVAQEALREMGIKLPIIGLAKKFEEIFVPGLSVSIRLKKTSSALKLLQNIRDEAHRFAVTYHRLLRSKGATRD
jgi:excinuclease ABC subunit C